MVVRVFRNKREEIQVRLAPETVGHQGGQDGDLLRVRLDVERPARVGHLAFAEEPGRVGGKVPAVGDVDEAEAFDWVQEGEVGRLGEAGEPMTEGKSAKDDDEKEGVGLGLDEAIVAIGQALGWEEGRHNGPSL